MTLISLLSYALAMAGASSAAVQASNAETAQPREPVAIDVGTAAWNRLPPLRAKQQDLNHGLLVAAVERILKSKQCAIPGQSPRTFDINVPYAVLIGPNGEANRVLVADTGCAPLELLVGETAIARSRRGDFKTVRTAKPRWYASSLSLSMQ